MTKDNNANGKGWYVARLGRGCNINWKHLSTPFTGKRESHEWGHYRLHWLLGSAQLTAQQILTLNLTLTAVNLLSMLYGPWVRLPVC